MKKIFRTIKLSMAILPVMLFIACGDWLDVVPEGVSRLENAFTMREQAEKYLYTCYSYMPRDGSYTADPAMLGGDDMWTVTNTTPFSFDVFNIARGMQNATSPLSNKWNGFYRAIRDCNIFLENVGNVPDMSNEERRQWIAEVKFLKAYYHFCLFRMYGPIPLVRDNFPIDADAVVVRVPREPVDVCVDYIIQLIDEAIPNLMFTETNATREYGRITRSIAMSAKALVLVTAASPLYNGNTDQATLKNKDNNEPLFNQTHQPEKWSRAVIACKEAVDMCVDSLGMKLYVYPGDARYHFTDTIMTEMSLRNAFYEFRDGTKSEIIWANTQSLTNDLQQRTVPYLDPAYVDYSGVRAWFGIPIKMAEMFYTDRGIPIEEDNIWDASKKYELQTITLANKLYMVQSEQTVHMHFNREPRFYAWVAFDQGIWYGQGKVDDRDPSALLHYSPRMGQIGGVFSAGYGPVTGYIPKKWIHVENKQNSNTSYTINPYPWPIMRLSDLFLLYAEALNEEADNSTNRALAIEYLNKVRERAGIPTVEESWGSYSNNKGKHTTREGLRLIIQRERNIELAFEGKRFWDIRRWKTATDEYKTPVMGWDLMQSTPTYFYNPQVLFRQRFNVKDYFWPISNSDLTINPNLVQNIGW